jgi:hypothetical protein
LAFDGSTSRFAKQLLACLEFSSAHEFEILSVREQPAGLVYTGQMINMAWRTGLPRKATGNVSTSFRDVMHMAPQEAAAMLHASPTARWQFLGRMKYVGRPPVAMVAYPCVRLRGYKGTCLYFLARLLQ